MKWSWLQNPSVALIELLASAIAIVQSLAWLCRYIYRLLIQAEGERYRRIRLAAALAALVVVVATSAVTWPVIIAEAAKGGDHGFIGVMYPLQFASLGLFGAVVLLTEARARERYYSSLAYNVLAVTLATVAVAFFFRSGPTGSIGLWATLSAPNLAIVVLLCMCFRYARRPGSAPPTRDGGSSGIPSPLPARGQSATQRSTAS